MHKFTFQTHEIIDVPEANLICYNVAVSESRFHNLLAHVSCKYFCTGKNRPTIPLLLNGRIEISYHVLIWNN